MSTLGNAALTAETATIGKYVWTSPDSAISLHGVETFNLALDSSTPQFGMLGGSLRHSRHFEDPLPALGSGAIVSEAISTGLALMSDGAHNDAGIAVDLALAVVGKRGSGLSLHFASYIFDGSNLDTGSVFVASIGYVFAPLPRAPAVTLAEAPVAAPQPAPAPVAAPPPDPLGGLAPDAAYARAKELAAAGNDAEACSLFAASWKARPELDVLFASADCHERTGKLAAAEAELLEAGDRAKAAGDPRAADADQRAAALAPRVASLRVVLPAGTNPGYVVRGDGDDITRLVGTIMPLEVGEHEIAVSAPGYVAWTTKVALVAGARTDLSVPPLAAAPPPPPPPVEPAREAPRDAGRRASGRVLALELLAGSVGTLAVGGLLGIAADDQWKLGQALCGGSASACAPSQLASARSQIGSARTLADVSTGAFVVSGLVAAVGGYLWFTTPSETAVHVTPAVDARGAGVVVGGGW